MSDAIAGRGEKRVRDAREETDLDVVGFYEDVLHVGGELPLGPDERVAAFL